MKEIFSYGHPVLVSTLTVEERDSLVHKGGGRDACLGLSQVSNYNIYTSNWMQWWLKTWTDSTIEHQSCGLNYSPFNHSGLFSTFSALFSGFTLIWENQVFSQNTAFLLSTVKTDFCVCSKEKLVKLILTMCRYIFPSGAHLSSLRTSYGKVFFESECLQQSLSLWFIQCQAKAGSDSNNSSHVAIFILLCQSPFTL